MSSILTSQSVVFATAMAVSGTVILLAFCRQKPPLSTVDRDSTSARPILRSCISSDEKRRDKKKKKRVQFAEDVVDPVGNGEDFRRQRRSPSLRFDQVCRSKTHEVQRMPANRVALYNGILRDRVQRTACSY